MGKALVGRGQSPALRHACEKKTRLWPAGRRHYPVYSIGFVQELPVIRWRFILACILMTAASALAQSGEIVPNENLVVEGVPKIPASLAETVDRYTNFRGASLDSWDPVKREMLIS